MKNRFIGLITVTFPDGYIEQCIVKEKVAKGEQHFIDVLKMNLSAILTGCPEGSVNVKYKGDLARKVYAGLEAVGADPKRLKISFKGK